MLAAVVGLHVLGWGMLIAVIAPENYQVGGQFFGVGLGVTAYTLGLRHAFDADHIAAIDNTTRKLMSDGKRPMSVGFWFSLGHSSVVFIMVALLAFGVRALAGALVDDQSSLQKTTSLFGTAISGTFLLLIGLLNLVVLVGIVDVFRKMRAGHYDEATLESHLDNRGLMNRLLRPVMKLVRKPVHMYPVIAGGAAASGLPWYAVLVLPILFAAGMSLLDSIDGSFMNFAYGWAFSKPVRKVYYNLVITGLSVAVALLIGGQELISILVDKLEITSGPLAAIGALNLNLMGYVVVALFIVTWAVALLVWRFGKVEQRWDRQLLS